MLGNSDNQTDDEVEEEEGSRYSQMEVSLYGDLIAKPRSSDQNLRSIYSVEDGDLEQEQQSNPHRSDGGEQQEEGILALRSFSISRDERQPELLIHSSAKGGIQKGYSGSRMVQQPSYLRSDDEQGENRDSKGFSEAQQLSEILEEREQLAVNCWSSSKLTYFFQANPLVFSLLSWMGPFRFMDLFMSGWPSKKMDALPYLNIPSTVFGILGFYLGLRSLNKPNVELSSFSARALLAFNEAGVIFVLIMKQQIRVYCADPSHLDASNNCEVSETTFWNFFFPPPVLIALAYAIWKTISIIQKKLWKERNIIGKIAVTVVNGLFNLLFYSQNIVDTAMIFQKSEEALWYEVAIPGAAALLLFKTWKPQHSQNIQNLITGVRISNLTYYMVDLSRHELSMPKYSSLWLAAIFQCLSGIAFVATSLYSIIRRAKQPVTEAPKPEVVIKMERVSREGALSSCCLSAQDDIDQDLYKIMDDPKSRTEFCRRLTDDLRKQGGFIRPEMGYWLSGGQSLQEFHAVPLLQPVSMTDNYFEASLPVIGSPPTSPLPIVPAFEASRKKGSSISNLSGAQATSEDHVDNKKRKNCCLCVAL